MVIHFAVQISFPFCFSHFKLWNFYLLKVMEEVLRKYYFFSHYRVLPTTNFQLVRSFSIQFVLSAFSSFSLKYMKSVARYFPFVCTVACKLNTLSRFGNVVDSQQPYIAWSVYRFPFMREYVKEGRRMRRIVKI